MADLCISHRGNGALARSTDRYEASVAQIMSYNRWQRGCNGGNGDNGDTLTKVVEEFQSKHAHDPQFWLHKTCIEQRRIQDKEGTANT